MEYLECMTGIEARMHLECLQSLDKKTMYAATLKKAHGYFGTKNGRVWVAFDDRSQDCWVEEFRKEEDAIQWLKENVEEIDIPATCPACGAVTHLLDVEEAKFLTKCDCGAELKVTVIDDKTVSVKQVHRKSWSAVLKFGLLVVVAWFAIGIVFDTSAHTWFTGA